MKKAGIYITLAIVFVFILFSAYVLFSRQSSPVLTYYTKLHVQSISDAGSNNIVNGKLNINKASQKELEMLPGIGETLAKRIIAYRLDHGRFKDIDDLLNVKGIGPIKLNTIRNYITTG